ncbi:MAG: AMP-binding protein [Caldilineaceae bacterium]
MRRSTFGGRPGRCRAPAAQRQRHAGVWHDRVQPGHSLPRSHAAGETKGRQRGSAGTSNTKVRVVDVATGQDLGPNQDGELLIWGPQVMKGYLNNPGATAATVDAEGWLHTGDIGYADEDCYFWIVDRVKELIKYNAYQVAPAGWAIL